MNSEGSREIRGKGANTPRGRAESVSEIRWEISRPPADHMRSTDAPGVAYLGPPPRAKLVPFSKNSDRPGEIRVNGENPRAGGPKQSMRFAVESRDFLTILLNLPRGRGSRISGPSPRQVRLVFEEFRQIPDKSE